MIWYFNKTSGNKSINKEKEEMNIKSSNHSGKYPKNFHELWQKTEEQKTKSASHSIHGQNELYSWLVFIIAVCYSMPAIQIVMQHQQISTGM